MHVVSCISPEVQWYCPLVLPRSGCFRFFIGQKCAAEIPLGGAVEQAHVFFFLFTLVGSWPADLDS